MKHLPEDLLHLEISLSLNDLRENSEEMILFG